MHGSPFFVGNAATIEGRRRGDPASRIAIPKDNPFRPFQLSDPRGFRRAIVPIFEQHVSEITGVGTAFHIGGRGRFLTANHNIPRKKYTGADIGEIVITDPFAPRLLLVLPIGLVFGTTMAPENAVVEVKRCGSPLVEIDDPIESLKGDEPMEALDIATLEAGISDDIGIETLPLRLKGPIPALGYPSIGAEKRYPDKSIVTLSEEMKGAFGRITGFHRSGRGRRNPTPVYQVEANWESGMSGGPVLNKAGEVIGLVSHSLLSDDIGVRNGIGYVSAFAFMVNVTESMRL